MERPRCLQVFSSEDRGFKTGFENLLRLFDVFGKTGHLIARARPGRFRILEDASLGFDIWFIVQGARWNKDLLGIAKSPWQGSSALATECACETLRPR